MNKIGQKKTQQRLLIKEIVEKASGPVTVNEIWDLAKVTQANMGVATVYRTVSLLLEGNQIQKIVLSDGQIRYEILETKDHHHHFLCRECERSYCFDVCPIDHSKVKKIPDKFLIETHEITFHGLCENCQTS